MEIHIEPGDRFHYGTKMRIDPFHVGCKIWRQDNFTCHIQSNHVDPFSGKFRQRSIGFIDNGGGVRIAPVVIFGYRGTVSVGFVCTTHGHKIMNTRKGVRVLLSESGKICQWTERNDGNIVL